MTTPPSGLSLSKPANSPTADFESQVDELRRIDFSGTIWFGSALIAVSILLASLLGSGWRPTQLSPLPDAVWWIGATLIAIALFGLAYAGCPVLGKPVSTEDRLKSVAIQLGVLFFGLGTILTLVPVLLTPA